MKIKIFISFVFSILLGVGGFLLIRDMRTKTKKPHQKISFIKVSVLGAVRFHDTFNVRMGITMQEVLTKAELLYGANLKEIDLHEKLYKDQKILVPFIKGLEKKYKVDRGITKDILIRRGVRRPTAITIVEYIKKEKGKNITWEDLDSLRGVGETTLTLLKEILDLN